MCPLPLVLHCACCPACPPPCPRLPPPACRSGHVPPARAALPAARISHHFHYLMYMSRE
ncbi:hypothetical protein JYU34_003945 [Plutella xylostella]|uniref:Uncharacterized protein n=1 Tax=Plutella xylostella TaxID=51655 RepID=A0ABQ7R197_PLUXY|nr:hypothetical protein JYU34_003945 [Plutella xylostella]